jgi:hypothetical protein
MYCDNNKKELFDRALLKRAVQEYYKTHSANNLYSPNQKLILADIKKRKELEAVK